VAIVHEDCSTDNSAAIIREYEAKYPDILRPIYETENQYSKQDGSLGRIMNAAIDATGAKYIAMCEGDDYWTDPYKLQKQVDFMETHPEYVMCCHSVDWYQEGKLIKQNIICQHDSDLRTEDIISQGGYYINICSVLFKKELMANRTNYQKIATVGDHPLCIKAALSGKVRFLHETMSVYRCFVKNGWTDTNYHDDKVKAIHFYNTICWMQAVNKETNKTYNSSILQLIGPLYSYTYKNGGFPNKWTYIKMSFEAGPKNIKRACKDILIEAFPWLWSIYNSIRVRSNKMEL
jgi:glycosyltransferase involved in cell wall biosynthesis